ncbi:hypothetical protein FO519_009875, partial [Halicephalobus sp. NKZ332]
IKEYNQKVALDLAKYLNEYYRGFDVYSVGINRADKSLVGKKSPESVIETTKNGWTVFVFRSPKSSSFQNLTSASTAISKIIDDYQDSSTENALCEKGNPEKTASEVFKAINKVCGAVSLCAILPFSNFGIAQVGNLQIHPYSLCNSMEFQGFHFIAGLNVDGDVDRDVGDHADEDSDETNLKELEDQFKSFLEGKEVKLEKHENKEEPALDSTRPLSTKEPIHKIDFIAAEDKFQKLNYTESLEHIPQTGPSPDPEFFNVKSTSIPMKSAGLLNPQEDENDANFSMFFIGSPRYFKNKTVVITGASRGIGKAIGLKLAKDGANIVIAAKTTEPHPKLPGTIYTAAEEIRQAGGKALACIVDVRDEQSVEKCVQETIKEFGKIDILINNASAISLTGTLDTPMKKYDLMNNINTRGTYLMSQKCLPYLLKSENPHIMNISPPLSMDPKWFGSHVAYTMAKYGMSMCVLGMSEEFRDSVAVNALWPRTMIWTAAASMLGGEAMKLASRKDDIMADAAYYVLQQKNSYTGKFLIDEFVLNEAGITNMDKYAFDPKVYLTPDLFVPDEFLTTLNSKL